MADVRNDFSRTAQDFGKVGKDAAYVVIGLGVLGIQKAQVRRRELFSQLETLEAPLGDARKALKEIEANLSQVIDRVDATLEPVEQRLPAAAQAVVQQAKDVRDQVRNYFASLAA